MTAMIHVADITPDLTVLIGDRGFVLRVGGRDVEADGGELIAALTRAQPLAALAARSETPVSGMSAPVERMLAKFCCSRVPAGCPAEIPSENGGVWKCTVEGEHDRHEADGASPLPVWYDGDTEASYE